MEINNSAHSTPKKIKTPKLFIKKTKKKNPKLSINFIGHIFQLVLPINSFEAHGGRKQYLRNVNI